MINEFAMKKATPFLALHNCYKTPVSKAMRRKMSLSINLKRNRVAVN